MRRRPELLDPRAVLGPSRRGLAMPEQAASYARRPALTPLRAARLGTRRPGRRNGRQARTKEQREARRLLMT
jgi:hypothetical protein